MRLYRLTKAGFDDHLTGLGGLYADGRWHRRGIPVIYTAQSGSLALLEVLANRQQRVLKDMRLLIYELPDTAPIRTLEPASLPAGWQAYEPYSANTIDIGMDFLLAGTEAGLRVPSSLMPSESDIVLHPSRALAAGLRVADVQPFEVSVRLML